MKNTKNFNIISFGIFLVWLVPSLTFAQLNMTLEGELDYTQELSDIWGYTDGQGHEYAIVGVYNGVSIVDISTDPSNPAEVAFLSGVNITWRDIKIWGNYAYVINESSAASGLRIIDLSNLPTSVTDTHSTLGVGFRDAHNIFIDENGIGYLFGATTVGAGNVGQGTLMIDLNTDPLNPTYLGIYNTNYVHDAFVRGDTMWTSEIYAGQVAVVDVSDKANPVILGTKDTPKDFAHACWPNDDNTILYVLEEKQGAWVLSYDVSDVTDIQELDRYQSLPGTNVIPHNTFVIDQNFVVNSYYTSGVVILDATHPHNMIEVASYDTSPFTGGVFSGVWGVYPYFPSGKIVASDIEEGLFVFNPTYQQACYLEGVITDVNTGLAIPNANVVIDGYLSAADQSDFSGNYATGTPLTGSYQVTFDATGYLPTTLTVTFTANGALTTLNVPLTPDTDIIIPLQFYLEGTYSNNTNMNTALATANLLPTSQPFDIAPWNYNGSEQFTTLPNNAVDWVLIELRDNNNNLIVGGQTAALLLADGTLLDENGSSGAIFDKTIVPSGNHYLLIRQRNHLDVITATTINTESPSSLDITINPGLVLGGTSQLTQMTDGRYALKAGDVNGNGTITVSDYNIYLSNASNISSFEPSDINLDGSVTVQDYNWYQINSSSIGVEQVRY